jgi:hypothetical protein
MIPWDAHMKTAASMPKGHQCALRKTRDPQRDAEVRKDPLNGKGKNAS